MSLLEGAIVLVAGVAAGFINTLAGGGSAITVPILTEMVGITTANGTLRIAVMAANLTAVAGFQRGKVVPWRRAVPLIAPTVLGAAAGAWLATLTEPGVMRRVFAVVLLFVAASVLLRPSRWLEERESVLSGPWQMLAFFGAGFYGGFVQVGVGFVLLAGLVLGGGLNLVNGNAAKVLLIACYSPVALLFFARAAQIDFGLGVVLAAGQMAGALIGARFAIAKGAGWVRWVLVGAAVLAAIRLALA